MLTPKPALKDSDTIIPKDQNIVLLYDPNNITKLQVNLFNAHNSSKALQSNPSNNIYSYRKLMVKDTKHLPLSGGGMPPMNPTIIDLTNLLEEGSNPLQTGRYPQQTKVVGIVHIATIPRTICTWRPPRPLPIRRGSHPIEDLLNPESFSLIQQATQQPPDDVLIYRVENRAELITSKCLQQLITHGEMTRDTILNNFLAILCHEYNLTFLSTFFIHILKRDQSWVNLNNWFAQTEASQSYSLPLLHSTLPILIPCHVNGAHWVGVVRRMLNGKVVFLYADDLNHDSTENNLRSLLQAYAPLEFYPQDAIWLNCKSITYRPHSNECGPRTLFALTAMALHPSPTQQLLMPYMSPNIAQILRTWVGTSLLSGKVNTPEWVAPNRPLSLSNTSVPTYLFSWTDRNSYISNHNNAVKLDANKCNKASRKNRGIIPHASTPLPTITRDQSRSDNTSTSKTKRKIDSKQTAKISIQPTIHDALKLPPRASKQDYDDVWGHYPETIEDKDTLRIVFANPKGLKLHSDILETEYSLGRCHSLGVGALCLAESNLNWGNVRATSKFHGMLKKIWKHSKTATSHTLDDFQVENQPGGTVTIAYNHWTSRVIEDGVDPYGLGRWSYLVLRGKGGIKLLLVTAYRVCKQTIQSAGYKTSTAQQFRHLSARFREANHTHDPIPRHQFIVDLQAWLEHRIASGYQITLGMDANEPYIPEEGNFIPLDYQLITPIPTKGHDGTLATLVRTSGLVDPLLHHHPDTPPPPTYDRGKEKIDFLFVSAALLPHITRSGIFPYNSLFISDHRPCYIDLDSLSIFNETTPEIAPQQFRGLQLYDPRLIDQYKATLMEQLNYHKVFGKAENLFKIAKEGLWQTVHTKQYESLDKLITESMLRAEKRISKKYSTTYQWSPTLKKAIHTLTYWKLRLSQLKGKTISHHSLQKIFKHTNLAAAVRLPLSLEVVIQYLREARHILRDVKKHHIECRSKHLEELVSAIITLRAPSLL